MGQIEHCLKTNVAAIALIQEPYKVKGRLAGITRKFIIIEQTGSADQNMAAVVIANQQLAVVKKAYACTTHQAAIELQISAKMYTIVIAYFQCWKETDGYLEDIKEIVTENKNKPLILGIDANAKSDLWFSKTKDYKGRTLELFL